MFSDCRLSKATLMLRSEVHPILVIRVRLLLWVLALSEAVGRHACSARLVDSPQSRPSELLSTQLIVSRCRSAVVWQACVPSLIRLGHRIKRTAAPWAMMLFVEAAQSLLLLACGSRPPA